MRPLVEGHERLVGERPAAPRNPIARLEVDRLERGAAPAPLGRGPAEAALAHQLEPVVVAALLEHAAPGVLRRSLGPASAGLEQQDLHPGACELERRGDPGRSGADHTDVRAERLARLEAAPVDDHARAAAESRSPARAPPGSSPRSRRRGPATPARTGGARRAPRAPCPAGRSRRTGRRPGSRRRAPPRGSRTCSSSSRRAALKGIWRHVRPGIANAASASSAVAHERPKAPTLPARTSPSSAGRKRCARIASSGGAWSRSSSTRSRLSRRRLRSSAALTYPGS